MNLFLAGVEDSSAKDCSQFPSKIAVNILSGFLDVGPRNTTRSDKTRTKGTNTEMTGDKIYCNERLSVSHSFIAVCNKT